MTSSKLVTPAEQVLGQILELLQEERLCRVLDDPLDMAARAFEVGEDAPLKGHRFHGLLSRFVRHLHQHRLAPVRHLADWEALSEAMELLETYASPSGGNGYYAAIVDASCEGQDGLGRILSSMLEAAKDRQRRAYQCWVLASNLDPLAWGLRCEVARVLQIRGQRCLPVQILRSPPARFADSCERLISDELANDHFLSQLAFSSYEPFAAETTEVDPPLPW